MTTINFPNAPQRHTHVAPDGFDPDALTAMRALAQDFRLRRRQPLPQPAADNIYTVTSGMIAVESTALPGRRTMVELLYAGDVFAPSLQPQASGLQCTAIAQSEIRSYTAGVLSAEMSRNASIAEFIFRQLSRQRACMQLHITMLAGLSSEERVAALLLQAGARLGSHHGGGVSFEMPLSRVEVAEYLALNADTLSRIMSRLVRDGILERASRARITVRDWESLKGHCPLASAVLALHSRT